MSEILSMIDVNNYGLQSMVAGGGAEPEDLTIELGAQDTALSTQVTTIDQLESALDNKIALDLADATSDANATANDIAKDKTAYVNGVKLTGTLEIPEKPMIPNGIRFAGNVTNMDWLADTDMSAITTTENMFSSCSAMTSVALPSVSNITNANYMFYGCTNLVTAPFFNFSTTQNVEVREMFDGCTNLVNVPAYDFSKVWDLTYAFKNCTSLVTININNIATTQVGRAPSTMGMFSGCTNLVNVPVIVGNISTNMSMFSGCSSLSEESLNNILKFCTDSCRNVQSVLKTLRSLGLSQTQAETCQTLSNWDAFVAAGWSTGY